MSERNSPDINAGSMADIAFLLLIFFLVTTTLDVETGIVKILPDKNAQKPIDVNAKNVLEIILNANNEILIEGKQIAQIENVRQCIIDFIDNGAGTDLKGNECYWCNGKKDITSSDHPDKAVIKLQYNRNTSYGNYISIQNEILGAYNDLRNELSISLYNKPFASLEAALKKEKNNTDLQLQIEFIKAKYPHHILEEEPIK